MRAIVVGSGRVGAEVARTLARENYSVVVVDKNQRAFRRLDGIDCEKIVGLGFDLDVLTEAGIEQAACLAAVTSGDNSNILTARIAKEYFNVPRVVARIMDPDRAGIYDRLGISTVAAVTWIGDKVMRSLRPPTLIPAWTDQTNSVQLIEIEAHESWVGHTLNAIDDLSSVTPVAFLRSGGGQLAAPGDVVQDRDRILISCTTDTVGQLAQILGIDETNEVSA